VTPPDVPPRCPVAGENTNGAYYCTRESEHDGPCAAVMTERECIRRDLSKQITDHLARTDVPARIGVPLVRARLDHREFHEDDGGWLLDEFEPGLWFPVTPEADVEMRELIWHALNGHLACERAGQVDAVLRALGLTGGDS
jgi:hypothetical protein